MDQQSATLRHRLGAIVYDIPRWMRAVPPNWLGGASSRDWVFYRNRDERLSVDSAGRGARCDWQWTSQVHVTNVYPALGRALMRRAFEQWPIEFAKKPAALHGEPEVSIIIGHAGAERLPLLLRTIESIAAQRAVRCECIVVEQSEIAHARAALPSWVQHIHAPPATREMPYSRSWSFNIGARAARGRLLVLHDNDLLVPASYCAELMARFDEGFGFINAKRFLFYLNRNHSARVVEAQATPCDASPEFVLQNAVGGSIAVGRDEYFAVGGFDESFVGWGNEDNEFWDRASGRRIWDFGYLPLVHLWHPPQPEKTDRGRATLSLYADRIRIPVAQRIAELAARPFGSLAQLSPPFADR